MYEPISQYGNYFVGVDGEGVKENGADDYVLLDSSLVDYPRLYTGSRLTSLECLEWLWNLGAHAGYCTFVLYGARYDFDNWVRNLDFEGVQRYADGKIVRIGDYLVLHQARFKFEVRLIRDEDESKPEFTAERYQYKRIKTRLGDERVDYIGLKFWDVLPFWQTKFVNALDMTLKDRALERDLIELGKEARGTFTHENIEWVSRYNKAECLNLAYMMVELDNWFKQAGIKPLHYNGPGSAAKALLRAHTPYMHAGRRISTRTKRVSGKVREYVFPGVDDAHSMMHRVLSAYAGGLNRQLQIGFWPGTGKRYDIISAYPFAMINLPCLSHGEWQRSSTFDPQAFGLWKIRYKASKLQPLYPFFWRTPDGSIEYPYSFDERWVHTTELRAALAVDADGVVLLDGWKWVPAFCDNPYPFWWVADSFATRQAHKASGNDGAALGLKLPLNSLYGSIAQARGGTVSAPPWTQQLLWAGAITAYTRARLYLAYSLNPKAIIHLATDGIISTEPLPLKLGKELGEWEETDLMEITCVQYGVYSALEWKEVEDMIYAVTLHRERGFHLTDDEAPEFVERVHEMWRTGHWNSMQVMQNLFVTAGLVAVSEKRFEEWCSWQQQPKNIELDAASIFKMGHVEKMPGMSRIHDASYNLTRLGASTPYQPKWGKGDDFPLEWKIADEIEAAQAVAM